MTPVASADEDAADAEDTEAAGTEYHFFPAESELSKEKYRQQQEQQRVADSRDTESQVEEAGDGDTSDLSKHLNSALNLATVTWTQVGQYL